MILIDANLLIYGIDRDAPLHHVTKEWIETTFSNEDDVLLPWVVLSAFIRITTHPRVMNRPLKLDVALEYVDSWLTLPNVRTPHPGEHHWKLWRNLLKHSGSGGNLTTDAHIAVLAIENGATLCSADHDFQRFPGVVHFNPLKLLDK